MRNKGLPEAIVRADMSLYYGAKTKVKVRSRLCEEFWVKGGVRQGSVLSPLLFAIAMDEIAENEREGLMNKILCEDDLVLMSESVMNLKEKFLK